MRFNLKSGIRKLGPTGFPFEKYIGEILEKSGYDVKINQTISGQCCTDYEIDFIAQKENVLFVGECKYRNDIGGRVHIDDALANYARFLDISSEALSKNAFPKSMKIKSLLVTNAKFTDKAIDYARCVGVELLGWGYPARNSLETVIERRKLYPITVLPSLNSFLAGFFAKEGKMLAQDILEADIAKLAKKTHLPENKIRQLVNEAKLLINGQEE